MENKKNNDALLSMLLGIISCAWVICRAYGAIPGLVCGSIAIFKGMKARKNTLGCMAIIGFITGIAGTVLCAVMLIVCLCVAVGMIFM